MEFLVLARSAQQEAQVREVLRILHAPQVGSAVAVQVQAAVLLKAESPVIRG